MGRKTSWKSSTLICSLFVVASAASPTWAVVIRGGDGSGNISAPADDPGWANVGSVGGATGIYLGDGWVLTAAHVWGSGQSTASFDGQSYAIQSDSAHRLQQPGTGSPIDLELFRLVGAPSDLPGLTLSSTAPPRSATVLGIGNGRNRSATETWWNSLWQQASPGDGTAHGFSYGSGNRKRWGENTIAQNNVLINAGYGDTYTLKTVFDAGGGISEMQAATGDSGGALFFKNGADWELAGVILAISSPYSGQPGGTALYGDATYYADLSRYRSQIQAIMNDPGANAVPEPGTAGLLVIVAIGLGAWYGWRRIRGGRLHAV